MVNQLSETEYELLCEALEDGFPDMLGRRNPKNRKTHGNIFSTNPLAEEVTYFMPYEDAPDSFDQNTRRNILDSDEEIYAEADGFRQYFALNPFGFNLEKLKRFFESRVAENEPLMIQKFNKYLETAEPYPLEFIMNEPGYPDVFDGVYNYHQWIENVMVPYSKIWFEHGIAALIRQAGRAEMMVIDGVPPPSKSRQEFFNENRMEAHFVLGRMVEQYRWKFRYENAVVQRKLQFELAGSGGGKSSNTKRNSRLEAFMEEIEELAELAELIDEDRLVAQAWDNVSKQRLDMPKTPKIRFEYEVELRSTDPFKTRYMAVFHKSA